MKLFVTAPYGMSHLLARELEQLGATEISPSSSGARCQADLTTAYRICLWSRIANRVLMPIAAFNGATPEQLYEKVKEMAWEEHLNSNGTLAVDCTAVDSPITHTKYAALKTKDAVCDYFREKTGERPSVDTETPDIRINLHLQRKRATVSLDLSGASLHQRAYRLDLTTAPLKENLAAALLLQSGWDEMAKSQAQLIDPMCGSGTILIEAAMIACDIAPGLQRPYFGFLKWNQHDAAIWSSLIDDAQSRRTQGVQNYPSIRGYDNNNEAIRAALANIERAQLRGLVHVEKRDVTQANTERFKEKGLIITNPPYGDRLSNPRELRAIYDALGQLIRSAPAGWNAAVFTGNLDYVPYIGLKSISSHGFYNGDIECQLLQYRVEAKPNTAPNVNAEVSDAPLSHGAQSFLNRFQKNIKHYKKRAESEKIHCYRVYDKDLPEYGVAIDLYQNESDQWLHIQEYEAPKTVDREKAQQRLQEIFSVLNRAFDMPSDHIFFKVRKQQKGPSQYEKMGQSQHFETVIEGNARFYVNFSDYLDTGLFLDHRLTRQLIFDLAKNRHFLNLFAYTGTASVHASLGGALSTTTVDMSNTYLSWAERNFELNKITDRKHRFFQANCIEWLQQECERDHPRRYDLIFIDPPTFSTSKRMEGTFDVQRDHVNLIIDAMQLLDKNGILIFSNNFRKFKLDEEELKRQIPGLEIDDITQKTIPFDFERNAKIHHCWKFTRARTT